MLIGIVVFLLVLVGLAAIYGVSAVVLAWAWNLLVSMFWATAPHLSFVAALAALVLISTVKGIFSMTVNNNKKS